MAFIESDAGEETSTKPFAGRTILGYRQTWAYLITHALTDPVWWFF